MKITVNGSVCGNDTALDIHRATIQVNGPRPGDDVPVTVGELDPLLADRIFWKHDAVLCNLFTENGSFSVVVRGLVERLIVTNKPVTRRIDVSGSFGGRRGSDGHIHADPFVTPLPLL